MSCLSPALWRVQNLQTHELAQRNRFWTHDCRRAATNSQLQVIRSVKHAVRTTLSVYLSPSRLGVYLALTRGQFRASSKTYGWWAKNVQLDIGRRGALYLSLFPAVNSSKAAFASTYGICFGGCLKQ